MMAAMREWLLSVEAAALLISAAESLLPAGTWKRFLSSLGGLILMLTMLRPLLNLDLDALRLDAGAYRAAVQTRTQELEAQQADELAAIIKERTETYILEKAAAMGIVCEVRVTVQTREDGAPLPYAAVLSCRRTQALANVMKQDLDIPEERQVWNGTA